MSSDTAYLVTLLNHTFPKVFTTSWAIVDSEAGDFLDRLLGGVEFAEEADELDTCFEWIKWWHISGLYFAGLCMFLRIPSREVLGTGERWASEDDVDA